MRDFHVHGPFDIPVTREDGGRRIATENLGPFWKKVGRNVGEGKGCYVFGIRMGRGILPWYVGRATKSFVQECFAHHKLAMHYYPSIVKRKRGTPVMFFVVLASRRGRTNLKAIREVERFLIEVAELRNPELSNIQGRDRARWTIHKVTCDCPGKPPNSARQFKLMMAGPS